MCLLRLWRLFNQTVSKCSLSQSSQKLVIEIFDVSTFKPCKKEWNVTLRPMGNKRPMARLDDLNQMEVIGVNIFMGVFTTGTSGSPSSSNRVSLSINLLLWIFWNLENLETCIFCFVIFAHFEILSLLPTEKKLPHGLRIKCPVSQKWLFVELNWAKYGIPDTNEAYTVMYMLH